jgi:hypothetical protein
MLTGGLVLAAGERICHDSCMASASGSLDESAIERINAVFGECGAFVRDVTLPDAALVRYQAAAA